MSSRHAVPDIVPDVPDDKLREIYGADADEIIAFRRFLALPQSVLPPDEWLDGRVPRKQISVRDDSERRAWLLYIRGRINGKRLLAALAWREQ